MTTFRGSLLEESLLSKVHPGKLLLLEIALQAPLNQQKMGGQFKISLIYRARDVVQWYSIYEVL